MAASRARAPARASVLVVSWFLLNLLAGGMSLGAGLYVSHIALLLLALAMLARTRVDGEANHVVAPIIALIVIGLWTLVTDSPGNIRLESEATKTVLLIVPAMVMWGHFSWRDIEAIARLAPGAVVVVLVATWALGIGDYYGNEGRFGVPWWGSPNSTAFLIAIAMALTLFTLQCRRQEARATWLGGILFWVQLAILGGFLLFTGSNGGRLGFAVILFIYLGVPMRVVLGMFLAALIAIPVFDIQLPELTGSGRLLIWQQLLENYAAGDPQVWILGYGPGAISLTSWFTALVQSAHSMYVEVLYGFGALGLALMLAALYRFGRGLATAHLDKPQRTFVTAIFCSLLIGFVVDSYLMAAQAIWLGAFLFSCGGLARPVRT